MEVKINTMRRGCLLTNTVVIIINPGVSDGNVRRAIDIPAVRVGSWGTGIRDGVDPESNLSIVSRPCSESKLT